MLRRKSSRKRRSKKREPSRCLKKAVRSMFSTPKNLLLTAPKSVSKASQKTNSVAACSDDDN